MLTDVVAGLPVLREILDRLRRGGSAPVVAGGVGALPALLLAAIARALDTRVVAVVPDEEEAERLALDLVAAGAGDVFRAPGPTLTPYQRIPPSLKARRDEFRLLAALAGGSRADAVVVPAHALFTRLPAPEAFAEMSVALAESEEISLPRLASRLTEIGYRRGDLVIETGDLAVRGGLFDVFPPDRELPLRIELDGDRIASIRVFDPDTQRSSTRVAQARIPPFATAPDSRDERELLEHRIGRPASEAERVVFAPAVRAMPSGWIGHAGTALLAVLEPARVEEEIADFSERIAGDRDPDRDVVRARGAASIRPTASARRSAPRCCASTGSRSPSPTRSGCPRRRSSDTRGGRRRRRRRSSARSRRRSKSSSRRAARAAPRRSGDSPASTRSPPPRTGNPAPWPSCRRRSRRDSDCANRASRVYAESEIFGEEKASATPRARLSEAFLSDLRDLKLGDAVVHRDYGIGLFKGLKKVAVEGEEREFMEIGYAEEKTLLLPVDRFDLVQKYSGLEGGPPALDRLGGAGWGRRKASVKRAMRDMTDQLLRLYARRRVVPGFSFSKDSPWQKEFEDAFEYTETADQAQAIADVKRDMQSERPMDRLLCGDVGYGKTEVAMRAAFKAVWTASRWRCSLRRRCSPTSTSGRSSAGSPRFR